MDAKSIIKSKRSRNSDGGRERAELSAPATAAGIIWGSFLPSKNKSFPLNNILEQVLEIGSFEMFGVSVWKSNIYFDSLVTFSFFEHIVCLFLTFFWLISSWRGKFRGGFCQGVPAPCQIPQTFAKSFVVK